MSLPLNKSGPPGEEQGKSSKGLVVKERTVFRQTVGYQVQWNPTCTGFSLANRRKKRQHDALLRSRSATARLASKLQPLATKRFTCIRQPKSAVLHGNQCKLKSRVTAHFFHTVLEEFTQSYLCSWSCLRPWALHCRQRSGCPRWWGLKTGHLSLNAIDLAIYGIFWGQGIDVPNGAHRVSEQPGPQCRALHVPGGSIRLVSRVFAGENLAAAARLRGVAQRQDCSKYPGLTLVECATIKGSGGVKVRRTSKDRRLYGTDLVYCYTGY